MAVTRPWAARLDPACRCKVAENKAFNTSKTVPLSGNYGRYIVLFFANNPPRGPGTLFITSPTRLCLYFIVLQLNRAFVVLSCAISELLLSASCGCYIIVPNSVQLDKNRVNTAYELCRYNSVLF